MFEEDLQALLAPLVGGRMFWNTTPDGFVLVDPILIAQQVGGKAGWYVDQSVPGHKHARIQIGTWALSKLVAAPLARLVENTIAASAFIAEPYGAFADDHQADLKIFGGHQDFGFWYPDP